MQGVTPIARKAGKHMALKKVVQSLEEVAEKFRSLYEELEGGGFGLTSELEVEGLVSAASVEGLVKNKEEILAELKKLKTTYKDVDPEKYAALLKENEEKERERQKLAGDFDTRDKQLTEKHARELAALNEKIGGLTVSLNQQLVDNAAREALVAAKAKAKGGISLLMPHIKTSTRVEEIDGRHVVRVMGPDGHARLSTKTGVTEPMTIAELVAEMRDNDEFSGCFEAENRTGGGTTGSTNSGGAAVYSMEDLRDPVKYRRAQEEAAKAGREVIMRD